MILINERFLSANHIQDIYVDKIRGQVRYAVIVQLTGNTAVLGRRENDALTMQMAFELRRRIVKAIVNYKRSGKPEIQQVDFPTYQEVHQKEDSENF